MNEYEGSRVIPLVEKREIDFAVYGDVYNACLCLGEQNSPVGPWKRTTAYPSRRVKTAAGGGAVAAVTAVEAGSAPFKHVAAGDSIHFLGEHAATQSRGGRRVVTVKTDSDNIEVGNDIDLDIVPADALFKVQDTGYEFLFRTLFCEEVAP